MFMTLAALYSKLFSTLLSSGHRSQSVSFLLQWRSLIATAESHCVGWS